MELENEQKRWLDRKSYFRCDEGQGYDKNVVALACFIWKEQLRYMASSINKE